MSHHSKKIAFSAPLHRRNVTLGKNETYYGFVLGTRYNRQHYWDYKGLFEYGLCLPRSNPLGAFTINTKGLKRLLAGDYDQAVGMERRGRARWKKLRTAFKMAALLHTNVGAGTDADTASVGKGADTASVGKGSQTKETKKKERPLTRSTLSSRASTASGQRNWVCYHRVDSHDSLLVEDSPPLLDERMLRLQQAGYAQINVMIRGYTLNSDQVDSDKYDSVSLPAGRLYRAGSIDRRHTRSAGTWRPRTSEPVVSAPGDSRKQRMALLRQAEIRRAVDLKLATASNYSVAQGDHVVVKNNLEGVGVTKLGLNQKLRSAREAGRGVYV
ncbi:hypothetical protein LSAT2_018925 [Lamellibrachia satsuma]|nr:hypothetical protein LSAT2_018925 [Lamellibrachia satsuma]